MNIYIPSMPPKLALVWFMGLSLLFSASLVSAHSQRDPTLPPTPSQRPLTSSEQVKTPIGIESGAMTIIVRNGQQYLVIGTLLYAQGDTIGPVLIVRITETEIWLSEGGMLRKVPLFPSIQRRKVELPTADTYCGSSSSTPSSTTAPCANVDL